MTLETFIIIYAIGFILTGVRLYFESKKSGDTVGDFLFYLFWLFLFWWWVFIYIIIVQLNKFLNL